MAQTYFPRLAHHPKCGAKNVGDKTYFSILWFVAYEFKIVWGAKNCRSYAKSMQKKGDTKINPLNAHQKELENKEQSLPTTKTMLSQQGRIQGWGAEFFAPPT